MIVILNKNSKGTKKCVIKQEGKLKDSKNCIEANRPGNKISFKKAA